MALLRVLQAPDTVEVGRTYPLEGPEVSIGRATDNTITFQDPALSRRHAWIVRTGQGWEVRDSQSANQTLLNGEPVGERILRSGDQIQVGDIILGFEELEGAWEDSPASTDPRVERSSAALVAPVAPKRGHGVLIAAGLSGLVVVAGLALVVFWLLGRGWPHGKASPGTGRVPLQATLQFRFKALSDIDAALGELADPGAREALARIDKVLWPVAQPKVGWAYLLGTSMICAGTGDGTTFPVAYYHPWSDVFLITVWTAPQDRPPRLTDVEVLMGDFVRKAGQPPFDTGWTWQDGKTYPPVALGRAAAESVAAFDRRFRGAPAGRSWRRRLPSLEDERVLEANRHGAAVQIARNMGEISSLLNPSRDDAGARAIHVGMAGVIDRLEAGRITDVFQEARGTLPEARAVLQTLPWEAWSHFRVSAYLPSEHSGLVMLSKGNQTDHFVAFLFLHEGSKARLSRIDYLSFGAFLGAGHDGGKTR